jgi:hypothetical protein
MDSRNFPTVSAEFLRGTTANTIDTGLIPTPVTSTVTSGPANRGVEMNTARGVKQGVELLDITPVEYAPCADKPEVIPFKVYGE